MTPAPRDTRTVRDLVKTVAVERGWPEDWRNDGAKGYLVGLSSGPIIFSAPGIEVRSPSVPQLLAMRIASRRGVTTWILPTLDVCSKNWRRARDARPPGNLCSRF